MSYVKVTPSVRDEINSKINGMYSAEIGRYDKPRSITSDYEIIYEFKDVLEGFYWHEFTHLRNIIPDNWKCVRPDVFFRCDEAGIKLNVPAPRDTKWELPPNFRDKAHYFDHDVDNFPLDYEGLTPLVKEVLFAWRDYNKLVKETAERYRLAGQQISNFLGKHKSINSALKAMPELVMYLPDSIVDRVNAKAARNKADADDSEEVMVDVDAIVSLAVAHRINTAA